MNWWRGAAQVSDSVALSSKVQLNAKAGMDALGFGARYKQHELPHETTAGSLRAATPGPGSYETHATRLGAEETPSGHSSSFTPTKIATDYRQDPTGDPGSYEPNHNREVRIPLPQPPGRLPFAIPPSTQPQLGGTHARANANRGDPRSGSSAVEAHQVCVPPQAAHTAAAVQRID